MRRALVVAMLLAGCASSREHHTVYVTVGADAVDAARALAPHHGGHFAVKAANPDVAVLELDENELDELTQLMHERFHRCGGYMVHDSLADARAALQQNAAVTAAVDYTIDHAPAVLAVLPVLDRAAIVGTIGELSGMKNRYYRSESGAASSHWLADRWRSFTTRKDVTVELFDQGYPQQSVILTIPGTTRANEVVVIGGHLDSISMGGKNGKAPGADDDASGIATLTEVARALLAKDYRPARTIKFIAYAAEEIGLRGSQAVVKEFKRRGINVVGALQLDMTNYQGSDKDIWLMKDFTSAPQNTFLTQLIDTYVGATWGMDACGYACSDHASWYRAGVPASMPFESRMRDRNMSIHTADDTLELSNRNADHALKFARLGASYAIEMAKGELGGATLATAPSAPHASGFGHYKLVALLAGLLLAAGLLVRRR